MKSLLRYLAEQNYYTAKVFWKWEQRRSMQAHGGRPIINYQMGKVGSSTVQASLVALGLDQPVYHVHFLNPVRVRQIEQQRRKYFRTERYGRLRRSWLYEFLYEQIQRKDRRWKLVTLVREPIARNISTFFENLEVTEKADATAYAVKSAYYGFDIEVALERPDPLIELFFERLVHERPLRYFNDEIRTVFFKEFLGIDGFSLVPANVAIGKVYAPLYRTFKSSIRLPKDYIDRMYDSKYTRQFYSDEEIQRFRRRWATGDSV
jgi:hypothetical protein